MHLPATNRPKCATGPKPPPLLRAFRGEKRAPDCFVRNSTVAGNAAGTYENQPLICALRYSFPYAAEASFFASVLLPSGSRHRPNVRICSCGNSPGDAYPPIPASRHSNRPPASPAARWSAPVFPDRESRQKQSALRGARRSGIGSQDNFLDGRCGGSACNCRRSNFKSILESRMGTGKRQNFFVLLCRSFLRKSPFAIASLFRTKAPDRIGHEWRARPANALPIARKADRANGPAKKTAAPVLRRNLPAPFLLRSTDSVPPAPASALYAPRANSCRRTPSCPSRSESCSTGKAASASQVSTPQRCQRFQNFRPVESTPPANCPGARIPRPRE